MMGKALEGIKVIDLTQFEAGPVATLSLAQMGAEIIKVERPKYGEQARMGARSSRGTRGPGADTIHFALLNPNKKSVTLDLKKEKGKEILLDLIRQGDVIVENYAPGTMEHLGFSYDVIREINPRIIYGSIKGYADESPYGKYPCFDGVAQAMGVVCSVTGEHDGPPMQSGANLADNLSGVYLAYGIVSALYQRTMTGRGQSVRINMQEVLIHTCRGAFVSQIDDGVENKRFGNKKFVNRAPHNMYPCKPRTEDGFNDYVFMYVSPVPGSPQWSKFCSLIERPEWIDDPVFSDPMKRAEHREELDAEITKWTRRFDKEDIMKRFADEGVPCGAVLSTKDIVEGEIYRQTGTIVEVTHPVLGTHKTLGNPFHMSDSSVEISASPTLGQDTEAVYKTYLHLSDEDLATLRAEGVI
ncbi:MAG: CoA transferase [Clostridiales bacterium]|nr:CoA transferase [Clostridiales bacterium]